MDITVFCGASTQEWSPKSVKEGVGGSEEMVIYLTTELAKEHRVTVYNRCGGDEGTYNGVKYVNFEEIPRDLETDILVVWRTPQYIIKELKGVKAKKKYLWLHDVMQEFMILPFIHFFDKIMCLSYYHRSPFQHISDDKFFMTRNAVRLEDFDQKITREPYTMVYGSSYDRGLKELLEQWSSIKSSFPEAKLRIFYGWDTFDRLQSIRKEPSMEYFKNYITEMMQQEGVEHLGKISHKDVAKEYLRAGFWAYPSNWGETSNITAMKAQIGGAIPVVIPTGATDETVLLGYKTTTHPLQFAFMDFDAQTPIDWRDLMIQALVDQKTADTIRPVMQKFARQAFDFPGLAKQWEGEFSK